MLTLAPIVYTGLRVANNVEQGTDPSPSDFLRTFGIVAMPLLVNLTVDDIVNLLNAQEISPEVAQALQEIPEQPPLEMSDEIDTDPNLPQESQTIANNLAKYGLDTLPTPFAEKLQERLNPSLQTQLENGEDCVVLRTKLIGVCDVLIDNHHAIKLTFQQHVADIRDLDLPYILELVQAISNGQNIRISDVAIACIKDLVNNPKAFLSAVSNYGQVYQALRGTREVSVTLYDQSFIAQEIRNEHSEEKSYEGENFEGKKIKTTDKTNIINVQNENIQTSHFTMNYGDALFEDKMLINAEAFSNKNYSADIIYFKEVKVNTKITSSTIEDNAWWNKLFGGASEQTPEVRKDESNIKESYYFVENKDISTAVADGHLTDEEISNLSAQEIDKKETTENNTNVISAGSREFNSGWIEYVPLGSIVTLGSKHLHGFEISTGDIAWAMADGALTFATAGAGAALFKGATSAAKVTTNALKVASKEGVEAAIKSGAKDFGKVAVQTAKEMTQAPFQTLKGDIADIHKACGYLVKNGPIKTLKYAAKQIDSNIKQISNVINSKNKHDLDKLQGLDLNHHPNANLRNKIKVPDDPKLAAKYPKGVQYNNKGFPDFSPYEKNSVDISFSNNRAKDFAAANKAAGYSKTPAGYTWHHCENGHTMRLVPTDLHNAVRHGGGYALHNQQIAHVKKLGHDIVRGISFAGLESAKIVKNSSESKIEESL